MVITVLAHSSNRIIFRKKHKLSFCQGKKWLRKTSLLSCFDGDLKWETHISLTAAVHADLQQDWQTPSCKYIWNRLYVTRELLPIIKLQTKQSIAVICPA